MDGEEKELQEQEQKEQQAYAEFLGKDPVTETQVIEENGGSENDQIEEEGKEDLKKPGKLEFYEIIYDKDNETYTMSKETFNHIKGIS
ncbi:hypothetical protein [Enterococcus sp. DIV0240a]|uniref:hypothetical protein n=1 Tax=Enterococcus sp. DIV0240a TaxID=2774651 RepID=UPI003D2D56C6